MNEAIKRVFPASPPQQQRSPSRRRTDLHVDPVGQGADAAFGMARKLEAFLPVILALHGWVLVTLYGTGGWQLLLLELVAATCATSLLIRKRRSRRDRHELSLRLRAGVVICAAFILAASTKGAASPFFLWLVAIVAIYPLILKPKLGLAVIAVVAVGYALMGFVPVAATLPMIEVASRTALLMFIGGLTYHLGVRLKSYEHVRNLANIDELTGVFNRRHFFERAWLEYIRCERQGAALAVVLFDLNDFKRINDTCGHALGDECLRRFAKALSTRARKGDVVARLGGDEFVVLMPDTGTKGAAELIRRVRSKLRRDLIDSPFGELNLKTCAGVATMTKATRGLENLLDNADRDLYRAKDRLDHKQVRDRRRHLQVA